MIGECRPQVQLIYLNELGDPSEQPVGISLLQLTIAPETRAAEQSRQLIERVQEEETDILGREEIIEVITTISFGTLRERSLQVC